MVDNCLRCGRQIKKKSSIERGYGERCFRIVNLQKPAVDTESEISFLKMEITMLKRQIKELKVSGVQRDVEIVRIQKKAGQVSSEELKLKGMIHQELISIFSDPDWKAKLLVNVNDLNTTREVPL